MEYVEEEINKFLLEISNNDLEMFEALLINKIENYSLFEEKQYFLYKLINLLRKQKSNLMTEKYLESDENINRNIRDNIKILKRKIHISSNILNEITISKKQNEKSKFQFQKNHIVKTDNRIMLIKKSNRKKSKRERKRNFNCYQSKKYITNINVPRAEKIEIDKNKFNLTLSISQIDKIDKRFDINTRSLIEKINDTPNNKEILNQIISIYENIYHQSKIKSDDRDYMAIIEYVVKKLRLYNKRVHNSFESDSLPSKESNLLETDEIILNKNQYAILRKIYKKEPLDDYELSDILIAYKYFVRKIDEISDKNLMIDCSRNVEIIIVEIMYNNSQSIIRLNSITDEIKNKMNSFEKDSSERKMLKILYNNFKNILKIYNENNTTKKENPYYEVIDYLLQSDQNYLYIKEILKRKKAVCNIRHNDEHIVIHILDLYIDNFKKMIRDKNSDYINPNYLKQVYFLFTKNYYLRMNNEEKQMIDLKLKELNLYMKSTLIKQKRKNAANEEIKQLKSRMFYKIINEYEFEEFDDDKLGYERISIMNNLKNHVKDKESSDAFLIGGQAYNLTEVDGIKFLKVYAIDLHYYLVRNSVMGRYLQKCEFCKEKIDEFVAKAFQFQLNGTYPVTAYELEFYPSGKFKELKVSRDIITIKNRYTNSNTNEESLSIFDLYHKSVVKNGGTISQFDLYKINDHFNDLLNQAYVNFLEENSLPTIYYGYNLATNSEIEHNLNMISNSLSELDKSESRDIINVFSSKIDVPHYSNLPFENGVHNFHLTDNFNYLGVENNRMLGDLYFNDCLYSDMERLRKLKTKYLNEYYDKVEELNSNIDYVDPMTIKMSKRKIKNKLHL